MRGQAHALEGIVAAMLLLSSLVFALQMTAVTPLSASTSSQHIENQQQASAEGLLATAAETGALERAILYWNASGERFWNATGDGGYYRTDAPNNTFGRMLERSFGSRGIATNVYVVYYDGGNLKRRPMVYRGVPSDNAVSATRTVTLTDDAVFYDHEVEPTATTVNASNFYVAPQSDSVVYNVVRVEVVVWRI